MFLSRWFRRANTRLTDTGEGGHRAGPQTKAVGDIPSGNMSLDQEKPMQDKHTSTRGVVFPRLVGLGAREYRRSGPNTRNGLYNYESAQGDRLEVAQVEIRYVTERGPALGNVVNNEAMTDILIKESLSGSLVIDGLPPSASDRFKAGDIWLVCNIEEDSDDPEAFPSAAGACRLRNGNTDDPPGGIKPAPRPRRPDDSGEAADTASAGSVNPNARYQGMIGSLNPKGFGFVHGTRPRSIETLTSPSRMSSR